MKDKLMAITLQDVFPNARIGLSQIGFFFGAGTSLCAGYPLTRDLTISVIDRLSSTEKTVLKEMLLNESIIADFRNPDIELLSDILYKNIVDTSDSTLKAIELNLKKILFDVIYNITPVDYQYHIKFFSNLKSLINNQQQPIWIFTTNYDLLLEISASEVSFRIKNSFEGIGKRYFNITDFENTIGKITSANTFQPLKEPIINLVKLHGSISWFKENNKITEQFDFSNLGIDQHCMILPRRRKVFDTLDSPYDQLFRYSSNILGRKCKFLVTFGYSYRDQHINQILLLPKLQDRSIKIFAFLKEETTELEQFKSYPNFNYLIESKYKLEGKEYNEASNLWDFKEFINLLA
jgi:hypothetical protein